MRIEAFKINGDYYIKRNYGILAITPFKILVPVCNLQWMLSKKHSFVMHIVGQKQHTGKAWAYAQIPVKQVTISGDAESVQCFMEEIGVDYHEYDYIRDCWCPNIWHTVTRLDKSTYDRNINRYAVYYKTSDGKIHHTCVSNPRSVTCCPKWRNATKIHISKIF